MFEKVTADLLEALAGMPGPSAQPKVEKDDEIFRSITQAKSGGRFDVDGWLATHRIKFVRKGLWKDGTKWILAVCPFNPEHTGPNKAIVGQRANGAVFAKCQHASCAGKKWHDMRDKYEPGWRDKATDVKPLESATDPHRLARNFLETGYSHPDGPTLRYHREDWFLWEDAAYREEPRADLEARLTESIKQEFDRESMDAQRRGDGKRIVARQVTNGIVSNVKSALRSRVLVPASYGQPCWIGEPGPWPASEVLPAPNGLFHIPSLIDGRDEHREPTPRFFSTFALDYPILPDAPSPVSWLAFLKKIWAEDPQCIETLQEFMGYVLTPDTSQQKMLVLIGPKRAGKGVITTVATGLVGSKNVAGTTLNSLRGSFGLEDLLGKALATIPDARLRGQSDAVLERLLSITGEDLLTVERKHMTSLNVKLSTRLMMSSNEFPHFDDASGALVSRMILLRLTKSFYGKEDRSLKRRCLAERSGILLWALAGLRRLGERGHFVQPDSATELLSEMEDISSPVGEFVRDRCVVGPFYEIVKVELYDAYKEWCEETGRKHPFAPNIFGRNLYAVVKHLESGQPRSGGERQRVYKGIDLRSRQT